MSFSIIGNMNTYLKSMQMKSVWDLKKKSGDYDAKGATDIQQMLDQIAGKTEDGSRQQDEKLSEILQKVYAGKKLTSDEMEYLRDKAPLVYKELVAIEEEQKAYERELRRCETKEEVERLRMNKINSSLMTVNAVGSNPNIPEGMKMAIIGQEKRRVDAIVESTEKFVKSGEYAKLPTEAEAAAARKEQMEELYRKPEQEKSVQEEQGTENIPETQQGAEEQEGEGSGESGAQDVENGQNSETGGTKAERNSIEQKKPEINIETEEERKVRRAKARAAYAALASNGDAQSMTTHVLDLKM